jgi:heme-degrading monooxygenase HmoA
MVVIVFRTRMRQDIPEAKLGELGAMAQRMSELASGMPGFISYKDFVAEDGENVSIVEFESAETLSAWRDHPEHRAVQTRGRTDFFAEYRIQVCTPIRDYSFRWDEDDRQERA